MSGVTLQNTAGCECCLDTSWCNTAGVKWQQSVRTACKISFFLSFCLSVSFFTFFSFLSFVLFCWFCASILLFGFLVVLIWGGRGLGEGEGADRGRQVVVVLCECVCYCLFVRLLVWGTFWHVGGRFILLFVVAVLLVFFCLFRFLSGGGDGVLHNLYIQCFKITDSVWETPLRQSCQTHSS